MRASTKTIYITLALLVSACSSLEEHVGNERPAEAEMHALEEDLASSATEADIHVAYEAKREPVAKQKIANASMPLLSRQINPAVIMPNAAPLDRENYHHFEDNPLQITQDNQVSTFSIDVDTASYSNVRRVLNQGSLPRKDAVRVEELVNYFNYAYETPTKLDQPFSVYTEVATAPWNQDRLLLHIGLKGFEVPKEQLPPANLVFLIDVSGSMQDANKLGLLKKGFRLLTKQLTADDSVSIVVYAGSSGVVLEPTPGDQRAKILSAIDRLRAGGSTNGAAGINLAYQMAQQNYQKDGINRVILATDGDFNVGTTNFEALIELVENQREKGIALTTLGFGAGNYNDHLMEQLADKGNGNAAYIDNLQEARKVLVEQMGQTLLTIAKDVKIQIEFNPQVVHSYRLIGYENRALKREDFNNDKVDAGEIGAGHTVTAIYEITPAGAENKSVDSLRYVKNNLNPEEPMQPNQNELAYLKLRYKHPGEDKSKLIQAAIINPENPVVTKNASDTFKFSAAVAAFGQRLRGGEFLNQFDYENIVKLGQDSKGKDPWGYRSEFINLVRLANELDH